MNRNIFLLIALMSSPFFAIAQNVGIGTTTSARAKLEVHGVSGAGRTSGIFGGDLGISLQRNLPAVGFNQYRDDSLETNNGRYLGNGYAAAMYYRHNDLTLSTGFEMFIYPSGLTNNLIPAGIRPIKLTNNGRLSFMTDGNAVLEVGRGTGFEGTAMFQGTNYQSHFNYSTGENTYIRSGRGNQVYINDIVGGKVVFGDGAAKIGVNTSSPVYTLEVRQIAGTGLKMTNTLYPNQSWEWRVANSPTNFYAYYNGAVKTYFSPNDGSLHPVSDERLKTKIHTLPPVLDKILALQPVSYEMINDNPTHTRSIGFIAQQVLPLFPQLVSLGSDGNDTMGIQYSGFGTIAIKGVQEEQQLIAALENKLSAAEKRMLEIERKIAALKPIGKSQLTNNKKQIINSK